MTSPRFLSAADSSAAADDRLHSALPRSFRVGIVGARTQRQGIGQHVARYLAAHGATVAGVVGTRWQTVDEACAALSARYGIKCCGYVGLESLLRREPLDALAICSPDACHREQLQLALDHRLHVLCEKPLIYQPGMELAHTAQPLIAGMQSAGKVLMVNEQWPYTLTEFGQLFPEVWPNPAAPRHLQMRLSPTVRGAAMIPNAVPHLLSFLFAVCPAGGQLEQLRIEVDPVCANRPAEATGLTVRFNYVHRQGFTAVELELREVPEPPRPAGFALDGCAVRREIALPDYRLSLATDAPRAAAHGAENSPRRVPLVDPLSRLVATFLRRLTDAEQAGPGAVWSDTTLVERLSLLQTIDRAARRCLLAEESPPAPTHDAISADQPQAPRPHWFIPRKPTAHKPLGG